MATDPIYRIRTVFTGVAGAPYYSNLYFSSLGGTEEQARVAVYTLWQALATTLRSGMTGTVQADVPLIDPVTGDILNVNTGTDKITTFTNSTAPLPPSNQGLVRLLTGAFVGGRQVRGRTFIPGLTIGASTTAGAVTSAIQTQLNTNFATLVGTANADLVVWSRKNGLWNAVNAATTWGQFGSLRSRRD